ncbi:ureidoglycolate hydrolase [Niveomyces insectorum RCEF 264]|uniref:Ureidoglycolate hydrolase n=1 Tax=Niveomyces insectorum RCEF 264 TaxID=1081102 RepID=A0A167YSD6_9HYPO|nr:ureidoglycolate hydrolase [Niveomyces insectorum RCEF 264]
MPDRLDVANLRLCVAAEPLTAAAFAPFGDVIENPRPDVHPWHYAAAFGSSSSSSLSSSSLRSPPPFQAVSANQGSAIKYQHVSALADRYASLHAPSGRPSAPVANMFVCAARTLLSSEVKGKIAGTGTGKTTPTPPPSGGLFPVTILERHPFTTQTFVPLPGHNSREAARYLVVVAPTVAEDGGNDRTSTTGPPDVRGLRAFVARGDQAVTYGAGTWHAPMAALGTPGTALPFFVFQYANGVDDEDCQEIVLDSGAHDAQGTSAVTVRVPPETGSSIRTEHSPLQTKL